jgi:putative membrane protein
MRVLLISCSVFLIWSAIRPKDYGVWLFEIAAGLIGVTILALTYRRFRFSDFIYLLVAIHFAVLAIAAKYTYAEMPLFNWLRDSLGLARNHFDRVGHFLQGFVPAMIAREFLLRFSPLKPGRILAFLCISIALAISAFWELIEWWTVIVFYPTAGPEWLGTQGDPWDAQWDMFMAFAGAVVSILLLSAAHDRSMKKNQRKNSAAASSRMARTLGWS